MEIRECIFSVAVAALSVMGFYSILHGLFERFLLPRQLVSAVMIRKKTDPAELDILLCEALRAPHSRRGRPLLLIDASLLNGEMGTGGRLAEEYEELVERYGAEVCAVEPLE